MKKLLLSIALLAIPAMAQDFVAAGASFNGTTVTPFGAYGHALGNGVYIVSGVQVTQIRLKPQITFQTVATQDIGYDFSTLLPANLQARVRLIGIGGAGASASSTSLTGAFDGGGVAVFTFKHFNVDVGAKVIKTAQAGIQTLPMIAISAHL